MKKLILAALSVLALAGHAFAEVSPIRLGSALGDTGQTAVLTNTVPTNTAESTNVGSPVDVKEWQRVALQVSFNSATAGTTNIAFVFVRSGSRDKSTAVYETTPTLTWNVPANGTNTVVAHTNLPLDTITGTSFIKLKSVTTASGGNSCSNLTVTIVRKRP